MTFDHFKSTLDFNSLNKKRLALKTDWDFKFMILLIVFFIFTVFYFYYNYTQGYVTIFLCAGIIVAVKKIFEKYRRNEFINFFVSSVLNKLLVSLGYRLTFDLKNKQQAEDINNSGLLGFNDFVSSKSSVLLGGYFQETRVVISSISLEPFGKFGAVFFDGLFVNLFYGLDKFHHFTLIIKKESSEKKVNGGFHSFFSIECKDAYMNNLFSNPQFKNKLEQLSKMLNQNAFISVYNGSLLILLEDARKYFVFDYKKPVEDLTNEAYDQFLTIYTTICLIKDFFETTILNPLILSQQEDGFKPAPNLTIMRAEN
jgi:hypothetical protein